MMPNKEINYIKDAYLVLANGKVFGAKRFGAENDVVGEIVFTTNMTSHLQTITDLNYYGQIVVSTFPMVGNYGVIPEEFESEKPALAAYIVREWCQEPSNFRSEGNLDAFLKSKNIVGLYDLDTRELTKIIRKYGVMNAYISSKRPNVNRAVSIMNKSSVKNPVKFVTTENIIKPKTKGKYNIIVWDFGINKSIIKKLEKRDCSVTIVPAYTKSEDILKMEPNGILLSNGPGDPSENKSIIDEIALVCQSGIPIVGIGLGHQMLALSQGAKVKRLKHGHRGDNHPVRDLESGRTYITSQNHDYAIDRHSLPFHAVKSFTNINDKSNEGIDYTNMPIFSVQFNPESSTNPSGTGFIYDRFISLVEGVKKNATE